MLQSRSGQKQPAKENIFVRSEYKMVKIDLHEIDYIEGLEDYVKIYINNSKPVLTLTTMKAFMEKLPGAKFLRIHRSYIIPLSKVASVMNKKVLLKSGHTIPVSDTDTADLNSH